MGLDKSLLIWFDFFLLKIGRYGFRYRRKNKKKKKLERHFDKHDNQIEILNPFCSLLSSYLKGSILFSDIQFA